MANSDIDAASAAEVDAARAKFGPEIVAEGRARTGNDIDGDDGETNDLQARLVLRWNLYRGGIDKANEQEQIRRASEQRLVLHQVYREIEEAVRVSWERRFRQAELAASLAVAGELPARARRFLPRAVQGRPALAARRARRAEHAASTPRRCRIRRAYASLFAEYRLLAATGQLLKTLGHLARQAVGRLCPRRVRTCRRPRTTETYARTPSQQENDLPFDILAPVRKKVARRVKPRGTEAVRTFRERASQASPAGR